MLLSLVTLALLALSILLWVYRSEVKSLQRQLDFLSGHESNKLISSGLRLKELTALVASLNRLLEAQKLAREEYQVKDRELKEAISYISHDIRTPLTSLAGYFELLNHTADEAKREAYRRIIENRIEQLKILLDDSFTFVKLQDDRYQLAQEPVELGALLRTVLLSFYRSFAAKNMMPVLQLSEQKFHVLADKSSLERCLGNLLDNSLKHGGQELCLQLKAEGGQAVLILQNDVLQPQDLDIDQVFIRFYKSDTARSKNSSGLGLAIVKNLVTKIGGTITAELQENIFRIKLVLPLTDAKADRR